MGEERTSKRIRERLELQLPVRVVCRETPDFEWVEITRLQNVTPFGARFSLKRPTEKGRLLHMTIPMPRQLRVFDHAEDQYRIWALVRYVQANTTDVNKVLFDVGVAFIGKRPPASYEAEPWRRYEIASSTPPTMATTPEIKPIVTSDQRAHTRHNIAVDMKIEYLNPDGEIAQSEETVTEDISKGGATLFTTMEVSTGRFMRLTSSQYGITVFAAIRATNRGVDGIKRIHVEFIDREWPL